ncbi:MAG: hypothetical protein M3Q52_02075 [Pseudomonadota bacterium]|nr:hypothetical protein [Pseudomonadota bacterium]
MTTGEGFSACAQMLPMVRGGAPRESYWNYSFTAIRGEDGQVVGASKASKTAWSPSNARPKPLGNLAETSITN